MLSHLSVLASLPQAPGGRAESSPTTTSIPLDMMSGPQRSPHPTRRLAGVQLLLPPGMDLQIDVWRISSTSHRVQAARQARSGEVKPARWLGSGRWCGGVGSGLRYRIGTVNGGVDGSPLNGNAQSPAIPAGDQDRPRHGVPAQGSESAKIRITAVYCHGAARWMQGNRIKNT